MFNRLNFNIYIAITIISLFIFYYSYPAFCSEKVNYAMDVDETIMDYEELVSLLYEKQINNKIINDDMSKAELLSDSNYYVYKSILDDVVINHNSEGSLHAVTIGFAVVDPMEKLSALTADDGYTLISPWKKDSTISVKGRQTLYYYEKIINGVTHYKLYKVSGQYVMLDSSMSVKSQSVIYTQTGLNSSNLAVQETNNSNPYQPTSSTWNKSTGFSNYVCPTGYGIMGSNYKITLKRTNGASTWSYTISTRVF